MEEEEEEDTIIVVLKSTIKDDHHRQQEVVSGGGHIVALKSTIKDYHHHQAEVEGDEGGAERLGQPHVAVDDAPARAAAASALPPSHCRASRDRTHDRVPSTGGPRGASKATPEPPRHAALAWTSRR